MQWAGTQESNFLSLQIVLRQDFMETHGQLSWAGSSTNTNLCFEVEFSECMILRKLFNLGYDFTLVIFFSGSACFDFAILNYSEIPRAYLAGAFLFTLSHQE